MSNTELQNIIASHRLALQYFESILNDKQRTRKTEKDLKQQAFITKRKKTFRK